MRSNKSKSHVQKNIGTDVVLARLDELERLIHKLIQEKNFNSNDVLKNEVVIMKGQINKA